MPTDEQPKSIIIEHWANFDRILIEELKLRGYQSDTVLIRAFEDDRLNEFLLRGTDRDASSILYDVPVADASAGDRAAAGISPMNVTYAHTVKIRDQKAFITYLNPKFPEVDLASVYVDYDIYIPETTIAVVYDPSKLRRASEVEYWFESDPRDAVLFVASFKKITK